MHLCPDSIGDIGLENLIQHHSLQCCAVDHMQILSVSSDGCALKVQSMTHLVVSDLF